MNSINKASVAGRIAVRLSGAPDGVERVFERAGIVVYDGDAPGDASAHVTVYDGRLCSSHAELFRRSPPVHLLAMRDHGACAEWEVRLLATMLKNEAWPVGARRRVGNLKGLEDACASAAAVATAAGGKPSTARLASEVMHELGANALLDAPVGPDGRPSYAHRRDDADLRIDPADACDAAVTVDPASKRLLIFVADRFGRMTPDPLARAITSVGAKAAMNPEGGGAGLGLRRLLDAADLVAWRVRRGASCEALVAVDLDGGRRRTAAAKTILFHELG